MPAIWASSERPLFVRTVWVDGMRHAVLSPDDPVVNPRLRHPRASVEKSFPVKHQQAEARLDRLNSCFMNLHVVVEKNFLDSKIPPRLVRRQSAPPCTRMCGEKSGGLLEIYVENDVGKLDEDRVNYRTKLENEETTFPRDESFDCNSSSIGQLRLQRDAFSAMTEYKQVDRSSDHTHWNPLSERVLQWLDLSGRAQDYEIETEEDSRGAREDGDRRWRRRRRHLSQTREDSAFTERERVVVQNYKLQKNFKLECETKFSRKRLSRVKDKVKGDEVREEDDEIGLKERASSAEDDDARNDEDDSRDDRSVAWSPPSRLQLHIVMPSFNSVEKRASSLESLACD